MPVFDGGFDEGGGELHNNEIRIRGNGRVLTEFGTV
jgi:hypothetical protein